MLLLLLADVSRALVQAAHGVSLLHVMCLQGDIELLCCRLLLVKRVAAAAASYAAAAAGHGDGAWCGMLQQQQGWSPLLLLVHGRGAQRCPAAASLQGIHATLNFSARLCHVACRNVPHIVTNKILHAYDAGPEQMVQAGVFCCINATIQGTNQGSSSSSHFTNSCLNADFFLLLALVAAATCPVAWLVPCGLPAAAGA
jgi:hypothetical protein